ncbi:MAG: hypothetical protein ACRBF0_04345 [Calditrichia bacterium]
MTFSRVLCFFSYLILCGCNPANSERRVATDISDLFGAQADSLTHTVKANDSFPRVDSIIDSSTNEVKEVFALPFKRTQGQKYTIRITEERKKTDAGKIKTDENSVSNIDVLIKEGNAEGYVMEWVYRNTDSNSPGAISKRVSKLGNLVQHESILFQVDSTGSPLRLLNSDELISSIELLVDRLAANASKEFKTAKEKKTFRALMSKMISPEFIRSELSEPLTLMHIASGGVFAIGDTIRFETTLPNFLGGDPMKGYGFIVLVDYDQTANRAKINWGQDVDPEEARNFVVTFLKQLTMSTGKPLDLEELPSFNISDRANIEIDLNGGWVLSSDYTRSMSALTTNQTQRILIETMPPVN